MTCTLEPLVSFQGLNLSSSSSPKSLDKIIFFTQPSESIPESFLASATPKPLYRVVKNLLSQNFSFSEQKSEIGFDEKKLPAINLDLNCAGIGGTNGYQNLPQESLFMENHLLKQTRELMEDFKINPNLLKGIDLVDGNRNDDDNDVGLGGAYDWAEKRLKISPFPIKPHDSTNYERFVFDNVLSHEMGHVKAVEKFGTPDYLEKKGIDFEYSEWTQEHVVDMIAKRNSSVFEFSKPQNYLKIFEKTKESEYDFLNQNKYSDWSENSWSKSFKPDDSLYFKDLNWDLHLHVHVNKEGLITGANIKDSKTNEILKRISNYEASMIDLFNYKNGYKEGNQFKW